MKSIYDMRFRLNSICLISLLCLAPVSAQDVPLSERIDRLVPTIDTVVGNRMEARQTPGLSLAVTTKDTLLFVGTYGYADMKLQSRVTRETLFQIGSISKSFTALALMRLLDTGRFDPDRPVKAYLDWFAVQTEFDPITPHHLLSHTAGIPANRDDFPGSPIQGVALRDQVTAWPPGDRFYYSNVGYQTLHALLIKLDGRPYGHIIKEDILRPLQMTETRSLITLESRKDQAVGYVVPYDDRPHQRSRPLVEAPHFEYGIGDGSIQSTSEDMTAYVRMLLNGGSGPNGRIVSEAAFKRFATPHIAFSEAQPENGYGYGIRISKQDGHLILSHSGGMVGFGALIYADVTDGLGVAVMANGPADLRTMAWYALNTFRAALQNKEIPDPPEPRTRPVPEDVNVYTGIFSGIAGKQLVFTAESGILLLGRSTNAIPLEPYGRDTFYTTAPGFERYVFRFERNEKREIVEVTHGPDWYTNDRYDGPKTFDVPESWLAFVGAYRNYSPWFPFFEIYLRKGKLIARTGAGGETAVGETVLTELAPGLFQAGKSPTPERIRFDTVVDRRALRAAWSGHLFYRTERPYDG